MEWNTDDWFTDDNNIFVFDNYYVFISSCMKYAYISEAQYYIFQFYFLNDNEFPLFHIISLYKNIIVISKPVIDIPFHVV